MREKKEAGRERQTDRMSKRQKEIERPIDRDRQNE